MLVVDRIGIEHCEVVLSLLVIIKDRMEPSLVQDGLAQDQLGIADTLEVDLPLDVGADGVEKQPTREHLAEEDSDLAVWQINQLERYTRARECNAAAAFNVKRRHAGAGRY